MKNKMAIRSHCLKLYFVTIVIIKCGRKVIWLWFLLYVSVSIFARVVDVRSAAVVGADVGVEKSLLPLTIKFANSLNVNLSWVRGETSISPENVNILKDSLH